VLRAAMGAQAGRVGRGDGQRGGGAGGDGGRAAAGEQGGACALSRMLVAGNQPIT
jgi:hypothetical protein